METKKIPLPAINPQNIFLVGNPNSGKTSLFNAITGEQHHVGNWPGVTVERLEGVTRTSNGDLHITDLPGTYSLSPATPEEALVLQTIDEAGRGTVLNVVDSTNMIRNLFLTTQLIELGINPVISLNCYDGFQEGGGQIDLQKFTALSGCEVYPTVARNGKGINTLINHLSTRERQDLEVKKSMLALPKEWQMALKAVLKLDELRWETATPTEKYNAINKLTHPKETSEDLEAIRESLCKELSKKNGKPVTPATLACDLAADRYHRIERMVPLCATIPQKTIPAWQQKLDSVLIHKYWGIPVFVVLMLFVFWTTFTLGEYPMKGLESLVELSANWVSSILNDGLLKDLIVEAGIKSIGSVLVFIPNILILFFWIVLLEDSGYMSRAAFIVDRLMKTIGLQGRAFIPMVMGLGCNVPAVLATRIIDSKYVRLLTMFLIPMVSCSARLPILVLLCGTFFPENPSLVMFGLFIINLVVLLLLGHFISLFSAAVDNSPFLLEMPPYRLPTVKSVGNMLREKAMHFLEKAGTVVLAGSIVIWALTTFPRNIQLSFDYNAEKIAIEQSVQLSEEDKSVELTNLENKKNIEEMSNRYMGKIGQFLQPVMAPFGFTWRETVSLIPGFLAKESIVATLTALYHPFDKDLGKAMAKNGMTPIKAMAFMLFTLLYVPCIATLGTIWRESGSTKFTFFSLLAYFGIAYGVSYIVLVVGSLFVSDGTKSSEEAVVIFISLLAGWVLLSRLIKGLQGSPDGAGCGAICSGNCSHCPSKKHCGR